MAKRSGGFRPGMGGGMQNMMQQAQRMQANIARVQEELEEKEVEASAGGGVVSAVVSGKKVLKNLTIAQEVVDPDDIEMLQDLIVAATNEAFRQMEAANSEAMSKLTGGLGGALGGGFPF